jgi:lipopolysaccharide transport system ATP-binding protein
MRDAVIRVENLSKQYRIGQTTGYGTLRDTIMARLRHPTMPLPTAENGDKHHIWALKEVSFEVQRGDVVGVIGQNGSGKSTLLKILSRVTEPTSGRVDIHGRVGSLLEVGTGFHPELSGRENVYLNGAIIGMSRAEVRRRFDEIIAFSEIERFLDTPVKHYSSGMYVRLAFAVAAHLDPDVLLLDEVLAVGDTAFQRKCLGRISHVAEQGRTVLFVSHNADSVLKLCNSAIWMEHGRIARAGDVASVVEAYLPRPTPPERATSVRFPVDKDAPMQLLNAILHGAPNGVAQMSDGFTFELTLLTRRLVAGAYVTVDIFDADERRVYWSADTDSPRFARPEEGTAVLECECPPLLLTPGTYSAGFAVYSPTVGVVHHAKDMRVRFEVVDHDSLLAEHGISYPGATAVRSAWKSSRSRERMEQ